MKKTAKTFIYISIGIRILLFILVEIFIFFGFLSVSYYDLYPIASIVFFSMGSILALAIPIVAIVVGHITLKRLENCKNKDDMLVISIVCLIFCSIIAGIILLLMDEKEFNVGIEEKKSDTKEENAGVSSLEKKINDLKRLKENGLITESEYEALRKKTISEELKL